MSFIKKIFSVISPNPDKNKEFSFDKFFPEDEPFVDEEFVSNFKKNGGKFLFCENWTELKEQFENILQENDWFESDVLCYENSFFELLKDNNLHFERPINPKFALTCCESLISREGAILFSSNQIKHFKPQELPKNIIVIASINQIIRSKSDGLSFIRNKYKGDYPSNITAIQYFNETAEADFTQYGNTAKNLYLLLLEKL
jgi:hypothetical protein